MVSCPPPYTEVECQSILVTSFLCKSMLCFDAATSFILAKERMVNKDLCALKSRAAHQPDMWKAAHRDVLNAAMLSVQWWGAELASEEHAGPTGVSQSVLY